MALGGACRADVSVGFDVGASGRGAVTASAVLDAEAVEAAGDLGRSLSLEDLSAAGWVVAPVEHRGNGGAVVRATHRFSNPSQVASLVRDLAGPVGAFSGVSVRQQRSFFRTSTSLRGRVDLGRGLGSFADPALVSALRGSGETPLGVADDRLLGGRAASEVFGLDVAARLPGRDEVRWQPVVGGVPVAITASAQQWNVANLAALAAAAVAASALVGLLLGYRR